MLIVVAVVALTAALASPAYANQATAAKDKPMLKCGAYYNWDRNLLLGITHPITRMKCANLLYGRWLDCVIKAYDRGTVTSASATCWKERDVMIQTIVNGKLPRIPKRNLLIDISDSLSRDCQGYEVMICSDLRTVESAIRKLQR
jgi:hypothetical protein